MSTDNDSSTNVDADSENNVEKVNELISDYASKVQADYEEVLNEQLIPILRDATNYTGDFRIVANYDVTVDSSTRKISNNEIILSLEYKNAPDPHDSFAYAEELVQRTILEKLFKEAVSVL